MSVTNPRLREAHERRYTLAGERGGSALRNAVKVYWKRATYTTWDEALTELAAGITVKVYCRTGRGRSGYSKHSITMRPDGSIDAPHHREYADDPAGAALLAGLGAALPQCVVAQIYLPGRTRVPNKVASHDSLNNKLRTLYAAVVWAAQRPDHHWTPDFGDRVLRYGVTPDTMDTWLHAGWDYETATKFWAHFVPFDLAEAWRAAGRTTKPDAKVAGLGEHPDEEARWAQAGFTAARSARWRNQGYAPEEAFDWDRNNVAPSLATALRRQALSPNGVPVEVVKQWCGAGIKAAEVLAWYNATQGDLEEALRWQAGRLAPGHYRDYAEWNQQNPGKQIRPEDTARWQRAWFPTGEPVLLRMAMTSGLDPEQYRQAAETAQDPASPLRVAMRQVFTVEDGYEWRYFAGPAEIPGWEFRAFKNGKRIEVSRFVFDWALAQQRRAAS